MAAGQITWEQFVTTNNDARGVRFKFEDLCRQLFMYEFLSENKYCKYLHSNPNNPGIESEPIYDEQTKRWIGYQVKYFDNGPDYSQIKESAEKAVKYYRGKLDHIYLYCNRPLTTKCDGYTKIVAILEAAGITVEPVTDTAVLDLVRKYPNLGKYYFNNHGINHDWLVYRANIAAGILGERYNSKFNVDTEASRQLSIFLQDDDAIAYFNSKKKALTDEIPLLQCELGELYANACKLLEFVSQLPDINVTSIYDVSSWQDKIESQFGEEIKGFEAKILEAQAGWNEVAALDRDKAYEYRRTIKKLERLLDPELFIEL